MKKAQRIAVAGLMMVFSAVLPPGALGQAPTVITNPTPASDDIFGDSVAVVDHGRVLVSAIFDDAGAVDSGAAYLFRTNGTLLVPFLNPTPAVDDEFGQGIAVVGTDRIVITAPFHNNSGDDDAGAAYVFSTNGTLLVTITNPLPEIDAAGNFFGFSVAAVGNERVLIGANRADVGAFLTGVAYLYNINGTLLTTITNPMPGGFDIFGSAVGALGTSALIIGAQNDDLVTTDAGAVYLFDTNGTLMTTFTNPTPANGDAFGGAVAGVGSDRVLIGAFNDDLAALNAGVVYMFHTNGTLLTTFTNPTPAESEQFGYSVASMGADKVLIGSLRDDTASPDAGAVYLFSTNGALLNTFVSPTPIDYGSFGTSVAAVGDGNVLVGASYETRGGSLAVGAAYIFSIPSARPGLSISLSPTNTVIVSWPSPSTGWTLQENTNGVGSVNWSNAPGAIQDNGTNKMVIVNPPMGSRFYRLFKP